MTNLAGRVSSNVGQQNAASMLFAFDQTDIVAMLSQSFSSGNANTQQIYLDKVHGTINLTNQNNNNATVVIYDVIQRRNEATSTRTDPYSSWITGVNTDEAGTGSPAFNTPYQTPFTSRLFTTAWKVLNVTETVLPAGGAHQHHVKFSPNKVINYEDMRGITSFGNLTLCSLVVVLGGVANDSTTKTSVSFGPSFIDWVSTVQYTAFTNTSARTVCTATSTLPLSFAVSQSVMNENTGA